MHNSILFSAVLAAGAIAGPLKRDDVTVTDVNVVYTTAVVTETVGAGPATTETTVVETTAEPVNHRYKWWGNYGSAKPYTTVTKATSTQASSTHVSTTQVVQSSTSVAPATSTSVSTTYSPSTTSSQVATTAAAAASGTATTFQQAVVNHHNYHRANHSAPAIQWNNTLASIAKDISASCYYAHNTQAGGGGYGQNIAAGSDIAHISNVISDLFYNGEVNLFKDSYYGQAQPDMSGFEGWGHFSQIVWKDTVSVGCYVQDCSSQGLGGLGGATNIQPYFTVCNYYPPGNYANEYGQNIGRSLNKPTIAGSYNVQYNSIKNPSV